MPVRAEYGEAPTTVGITMYGSKGEHGGNYCEIAKHWRREVRHLHASKMRASAMRHFATAKTAVEDLTIGKLRWINYR